MAGVKSWRVVLPSFSLGFLLMVVSRGTRGCTCVRGVPQEIAPSSVALYSILVAYSYRARRTQESRRATFDEAFLFSILILPTLVAKVPDWVPSQKRFLIARDCVHHQCHVGPHEPVSHHHDVRSVAVHPWTTATTTLRMVQVSYDALGFHSPDVGVSLGSQSPCRMVSSYNDNNNKNKVGLLSIPCSTVVGTTPPYFRVPVQCHWDTSSQ